MSAARPADVAALLEALRVEGDAVLVPVRAHPGAKHTGVQGVHAGRLKLSTHTAPESGKATAALCGELASALGVAASRVSCVRGAAARDKLLAVSGLGLDAVRDALAKALAAHDA